MAQAQTYRNHRRYFWPYHFVVQPILLANFLFQLGDFIKVPTMDTGWTAIVAFGVLLLSVTARAMALTAQNRVIRLEERIRLARLMPAEDQGRIEELATRHLVGLRFAPDNEVVELAKRCLSGELKTAADVKKNVQAWRPDYLRV